MTKVCSSTEDHWTTFHSFGDESEDQFAFAVTSGEDGTTAGNITIDSYAAFKAGVTTVSDLETGVISAADGTQSATIANSTGVMTIASSVLTTADINGGTVDGVTIGGASAGAGTFTNLTVNTDVDITDSGGDGTMDGVIIVWFDCGGGYIHNYSGYNCYVDQRTSH